MNSIISVLWVVMTLFILFQTSAVYEYLKVLRIPNFFSRIPEYERHREELEKSTITTPFIPSYGNYMRSNFNCFLVRWASCPYCIGLALSVASAFIFSKWEEIPIIYLGGILGYWLFSIATKWLEVRSVE